MAKKATDTQKQIKFLIKPKDQHILRMAAAMKNQSMAEFCTATSSQRCQILQAPKRFLKNRGDLKASALPTECPGKVFQISAST
ncbi:hypothetical protein V6x_16450 [Gimesia chilikensis]|uniref:DUF1778 domain-containing protein n=1 Tax=Gimesia chilikensis TaxID=2605989 RepID=A0A517W9N4_9PLAN|nr:hypothetical protein [Gimesia chilikensis]QDU01962.1 hypothetical protein V6x_16450 [Gimesia chilikensis]